MVYFARRFVVVCLALCHFVLVFFSPFSIAITSLWGGGVGAGLCAFRTFVQFVIVWICRFPLPLNVWEPPPPHPMVYSTDRSKAVVPVLVLLFGALWFILRGDLLYVLPCVILFLCFQSF